ncbi:hypothetical protein ETAA1_01030 [Urbifossiella limnaea]|uniref:Uncharacterized protein n=2 Tax=Urbifossiella limnaea TaxID=2528023 RepID=A0A517XL44_9BACT|nr:hypothetical protein ETAA1_01030 [Urbifossiella limnaea]
MDRHAFWGDRYSEIVRRGDRAPNGYDYSPEALDTFPRYHVLNAVLVEIERLVPADLGNLDAARELILLAGEVADDLFTRPPKGAIERRAMAEERAAFRAHVAGLTAADLTAVEPLLYRRVLTEAESQSLWVRLRDRWCIGACYWYPLDGDPPPGVEAFDAAAFDLAFPPDRLRRHLVARGIGRVWALHEFGPEFEIAVEQFEPYYAFVEGYWSSGNLDWIVYASHESSVTVGGWLLDELRTAWPAHRDHVWRG